MSARLGDSTKYGRTDLLNLNNWGVVVVLNKSVFYDVYSSIESDVIDPPTNSLHSKRGGLISNFNDCVWLFTAYIDEYVALLQHCASTCTGIGIPRQSHIMEVRTSRCHGAIIRQLHG